MCLATDSESSADLFSVKPKRTERVVPIINRVLSDNAELDRYCLCTLSQVIMALNFGERMQRVRTFSDFSKKSLGHFLIGTKCTLLSTKQSSVCTASSNL
mmetsp:Transcript_8002/g.14515  ORF Transcript_8002/g.14515 Transcript_8002/m.14515 type:complete len:100 (+) Transcript_8002:736-1035(+)